jgi:hypothetical protein
VQKKLGDDVYHSNKEKNRELAEPIPVCQLVDRIRRRRHLCLGCVGIPLSVESEKRPPLARPKSRIVLRHETHHGVSHAASMISSSLNNIGSLEKKEKKRRRRNDVQLALALAATCSRRRRCHHLPDAPAAAAAGVPFPSGVAGRGRPPPPRPPLNSNPPHAPLRRRASTPESRKKKDSERANESKCWLRVRCKERPRCTTVGKPLETQEKENGERNGSVPLHVRRTTTTRMTMTTTTMMMMMRRRKTTKTTSTSPRFARGRSAGPKVSWTRDRGAPSRSASKRTGGEAGGRRKAQERPTTTVKKAKKMRHAYAKPKRESEAARRASLARAN